MNYYESNRKGLKRRKERFLGKVDRLRQEEWKNPLDEVVDVTSREGTLVPMIRKQGETTSHRLNSSFAPGKEAEKWGEQYKEFGELTVFIMFGLGNLVFAEAIRKQLGENNRFLIYEPCTQLFLHGLEAYDYTSLLGDHRVGFVVEGINEIEFGDYLGEMLYWKNLDQVKVVIHPQFDLLFPGSCQEFCHQYEVHRDIAIRVHNTAKRFARVSIQNQWNNLSYLKGAYLADHLKHKIPPEVPVILVSAGPSLEKNIEELKRAKGHSLILCVDRALGTLLKHEIEPDFFISIDPEKFMDCFKNKKVKEIPLICTLNSCKALLNNHSGKKILCKEEKFTESIYNKLKLPLFEYYLGGCVATAAFAVCAEIGVRTIILAGQDLAYSKDKKSHSGGFEEEFQEEEQYVVEDVFGELIQSRYDWYAYLQWFNGAIAQCDWIEVIDATEGGARIKGTKICTLKEAVDTYCKGEITAESILSKLKPALSKSKENELDRIQLECVKEIGKIKEKAEQGIQLCCELLEVLEKEEVLSNEVLQKEKSLSDYNKWIMGRGIYYLIESYLELFDKKPERKRFSKKKEIQERLDLYNDFMVLYHNTIGAVDYIDIVEKTTRILQHLGHSCQYFRKDET